MEIIEIITALVGVPLAVPLGIYAWRSAERRADRYEKMLFSLIPNMRTELLIDD